MNYKIKEINLHITEYCKGHCPMCYATDEHMIRKHGNIETLKLIVHNSITYGKIDTFVLVGGDPCEHPNLMKLLKYIKEEGDKNHISTKSLVISNTHDYKENGENVCIEEVCKYVDGMCLTVHGENPEEHDKFNGCKGSYEHVINNLRKYCKLKKDGQSVCIIINLMPQTVIKMENIIKNVLFDLEGKIDCFAIQRIALIGRACGSKKYFIESNDINSVLYICNKIKKEHGCFFEFVDAFPFCSIKPEYRGLLPRGGCNWGKDFCAVFADGTISRCAMSKNKLSANITELDTQEKFSTFWNYDEELVKFRNKEHLDEQCKNCNLIEECGGACVLAREKGDPYKTEIPEKGHDYLAKRRK